MIKELHDHQWQTLDQLWTALRSTAKGGLGKRRVMTQAPTAFGKTVLAARIIEAGLKHKRRMIFSVPALSLIDQTVERFWEDGIRDVGVIQADHPMTDFSKPVQVASVQTLVRREVQPPDLLIIDEAHRWYDHYAALLGEHADPNKPGLWQQVPVIGLSATPWTKGLGKFFDHLIVGARTQDLIDAKFLSPFKVLAPAYPDLTGVQTVAGDYNEGQLATAMMRGTLIADTVQTWIERGERRPTLCFCVDRAHAKAMAERFGEAGVPCGYIDANTPNNERKRLRQLFKDRELEVICNIGVLTTGVDWPEISCLILARPTKSEMLFVQIVGRGLRIADGKTDCLILDHAGIHNHPDEKRRLGFVTDIHHDHLDEGKERAAAKASPPLAKPCPNCQALKPPRTPVCPHCGHRAQVVSHVDESMGELAEIKPGKRTGSRPAGTTYDERMRAFAMLIGYAGERGYKPGWARHKYEALFARPAPRREDWPPALPPDNPMRRWIKSQQIAWAKAQDAARRQAGAPIRDLMDGV